MYEKHITIGRLTKDIEKKSGQNGKSYYFVTLASDVGFGEHAHTNFRSMLVPETVGDRLVKAKAGKGSAIIAEYREEITSKKLADGTYSTDIRCTLENWEYPNFGKKRDEAAEKSSAATEGEFAAPQGDGDFTEVDSDELPFG